MSDHSTVPPLCREISQGDLAIWSVASVAGVERAVIEAIFDGQPDLVYLPNVARSSMQRFERAGIVFKVKSAGSQLRSSAQVTGAETRASGLGRTE